MTANIDNAYGAITPEMTGEQRIAARRAQVAQTKREAAEARAAAATAAAAHLLSESERLTVAASLTIDLELRPTAADGAAHRAARAIDRRRVGYSAHTDATEAARMVLKATLLAALAAPVAPAPAVEDEPAKPAQNGVAAALAFIVDSLESMPEMDLVGIEVYASAGSLDEFADDYGFDQATDVASAAEALRAIKSRL